MADAHLPIPDLPRSTVISGGRVWTSDGLVDSDVRIDGSGHIEAIGPDLGGDVRLDAGDCVVIPGLVDLQANVGEPGAEHVETVASAARAAALGGCTAIVATSDTPMPIDSAAAVREMQSITADAMCQVEVCGAATVGRAGEQLAPMGEMAALGVRLFGDNRTVAAGSLMRRVLDYAVGLGVTVVATGEDTALAADGQMHEGAVSSLLGVPGRPLLAETISTQRDAQLARLSGASVHFANLTNCESLDAVHAQAAQGAQITAHVTPHHLAFTDVDCAAFDPAYKVDPPLRAEDQRQSLVAAVRQGAVHAVASDHRPCADHAKERPFDRAEAGMIGLQTRLGLLLHAVPDLAIGDLIALLSARPAAIAGLESHHGAPLAVGRPANIAVIALDQPHVVSLATSASLSHNSPLDGWELPATVRHTIYQGEPVVHDGVPTR